jgi:hypothetical protein
VVRALSRVGLRRSVIAGVVIVLGVLVSSVGASAANPTTLNLCINPGGNVTTIVPPATSCGPAETEFTTVSAGALAALQAQVNALAAKEAQDVVTLNLAITALGQKEQTDINNLTTAAAGDETNDTAELAALQAQEVSDVGNLLATIKADELNFASLKNAFDADQTADAPIESQVGTITGVINGVIDAINNVIIGPINDVICGLSLGTDCHAITPLSHI